MAPEPELRISARGSAMTIKSIEHKSPKNNSSKLSDQEVKVTN